MIPLMADGLCLTWESRAAESGYSNTSSSPSIKRENWLRICGMPSNIRRGRQSLAGIANGMVRRTASGEVQGI